MTGGFQRQLEKETTNASFTATRILPLPKHVLRIQGFRTKVRKNLAVTQALFQRQASENGVMFSSILVRAGFFAKRFLAFIARANAKPPVPATSLLGVTRRSTQISDTTKPKKMAYASELRGGEHVLEKR
jgi:hypothetical protein